MKMLMPFFLIYSTLIPVAISDYCATGKSPEKIQNNLQSVELSKKIELPTNNLNNILQDNNIPNLLEEKLPNNLLGDSSAVSNNLIDEQVEKVVEPTVEVPVELEQPQEEIKPQPQVQPRVQYYKPQYRRGLFGRLIRIN